MFTGLVKDIGTVTEIEHRSRASRIGVSTGLDLSDGELGESIAVNGACFTVVSLSGTEFTVDVSAESLKRTTTGRLRRGDKVHLERAMRLSDRLGGHLVLGHVDGIGRLRSRCKDGVAMNLEFSAPPEVLRFMIDKGSIAINGVSLTVNSLGANGFGVTIIPHTGDCTLLTEIAIGSEVNLESDIIGKYVARLLEPDKSGGEERLVELLSEMKYRG